MSVGSVVEFSCPGARCLGAAEVPGFADGPVGAQRACNYFRGCIAAMIADGSVTENHAADVVIRFQQEYDAETAEATQNA